MPFHGSLYIEVEADSENEAIRKAASECSSDDFEDWEHDPSDAEVTCLDDEGQDVLPL